MGYAVMLWGAKKPVPAEYWCPYGTPGAKSKSLAIPMELLPLNTQKYSLRNRVNNSIHLWSEEISRVEEWILLDSNSSRVKFHNSTSGISSGSLDIHSKRSDQWGHSKGSDLSDK